MHTDVYNLSALYLYCVQGWYLCRKKYSPKKAKSFNRKWLLDAPNVKAILVNFG